MQDAIPLPLLSASGLQWPYLRRYLSFSLVNALYDHLNSGNWSPIQYANDP